jgi:hypothetical protein
MFPIENAFHDRQVSIQKKLFQIKIFRFPGAGRSQRGKQWFWLRWRAGSLTVERKTEPFHPALLYLNYRPTFPELNSE